MADVNPTRDETAECFVKLAGRDRTFHLVLLVEVSTPGMTDGQEQCLKSKTLKHPPKLVDELFAYFATTPTVCNAGHFVRGRL